MPSGLGFDVSDGRPFLVGDFTGTGRGDLLSFNPTDKSWWLGQFNGSQLEWTFVGSTAGPGHGMYPDRPLWVGDFTGGGRAELLSFNPTDKSWWLGQFNGNAMEWVLAGTTGYGPSVNVDHPLWVGEFTGEGRAELLSYNTNDNSWWLGRFRDTRLEWALAGNTAGLGHGLYVDHPLWAGDFTGDGKTDLLSYNTNDNSWWLGQFNGSQLQWTVAGNTAGLGRSLPWARPRRRTDLRPLTFFRATAEDAVS